ERGLVARPLRPRADVDAARPGRSDAELAARVRPAPRALPVAPPADAQGRAGGAPPFLLRAPAWIVQTLQHAVEAGHVVGRVIDDVDAVAVRQPGAIRHLLGADEIAAAEIGGIET